MTTVLAHESELEFAARRGAAIGDTMNGMTYSLYDDDHAQNPENV